MYERRDREVRYSLFEPGNLFIAQQRERSFLKLLRRHGFASLKSTRVLDVGCGTGYWLRELIKWGARSENLTGLDLIVDRVAVARHLCPPEVRIENGSVAQLPFRNDTFDLVMQMTVFTSILDAELRRQAAAEMMRVVRVDGLIVWYDFHVNNPWNDEVRGVTRREIYGLFPDCRIDLERLTLLPPLARVLAPYSYVTCCLLEKFPLLCTHYLGVIRKPLKSFT